MSAAHRAESWGLPCPKSRGLDPFLPIDLGFLAVRQAEKHPTFLHNHLPDDERPISLTERAGGLHIYEYMAKLYDQGPIGSVVEKLEDEQWEIKAASHFWHDRLYRHHGMVSKAVLNERFFIPKNIVNSHALPNSVSEMLATRWEAEDMCREVHNCSLLSFAHVMQSVVPNMRLRSKGTINMRLVRKIAMTKERSKQATSDVGAHIAKMAIISSSVSKKIHFPSRLIGNFADGILKAARNGLIGPINDLMRGDDKSFFVQGLRDYRDVEVVEFMNLSDGFWFPMMSSTRWSSIKSVTIC
jgi:hypothetical protein